MAGAVGGSAGALDRRPLAHVLHVAAERALVDRAVVVAAERHAGMFQLDHRGGRLAHHVFDRVLVAEPVGALDGVVHVPRPMVRRIVAQRRGDPALRRDGVRPGREHLRDARSLQPAFGDAHRRAQAGTAGTDDDRVIGMIDDLVGSSHQAEAPSATFRIAKTAVAPSAIDEDVEEDEKDDAALVMRIILDHDLQAETRVPEHRQHQQRHRHRDPAARQPRMHRARNRTTPIRATENSSHAISNRFAPAVSRWCHQ